MHNVVLPEHFSDEKILDEWPFFQNDRNSQGGIFQFFPKLKGVRDYDTEIVKM